MAKRNPGRKFSNEHEQWLKENVPTKRHFSWEPRGDRQTKAKEFINKFDLNFFIGAAGAGKSACAIWEALHLLDKGTVDQIIITKPTIEVGPSMGFLPGELNQKLSPYLESIYDLLKHYEGYQELIQSERLKGEALGFLRGKTFTKSYIVADEMQNSTISQILALLTRLGEGSKMVVTGDLMQIDLKGNQQNGLAEAMRLTEGHPEIGVVEFLEEDIQRHKLVKDIVKAAKAGHSLWNGS